MTRRRTSRLLQRLEYSLRALAANDCTRLFLMTSRLVVSTRQRSIVRQCGVIAIASSISQVPSLSIVLLPTADDCNFNGPAVSMCFGEWTICAARTCRHRARSTDEVEAERCVATERFLHFRRMRLTPDRVALTSGKVVAPEFTDARTRLRPCNPRCCDRRSGGRICSGPWPVCALATRAHDDRWVPEGEPES